MGKPTAVLGLSGYYHDSAAALLINGAVVAAVQEERFSRKRHDASFPKQAIEYCLKHAGMKVSDLSAIAFYDKPLIKFDRLIHTYLAYAPKGLVSFVTAMPVWLKEKLYLKETIKREFCELAGVRKKDLPKLLFMEHHHSHAASAFYPSPFSQAAVLCMDGVGEWATTSLWDGNHTLLKPVWEIDFPHSLGMLYSAFTYYTGFKVNSGEYKLMGLAPYGEPKYVQTILDHLIDVKDDGTFRLNMEYFGFATGLAMTNSRFHKLFEGPPRTPETQVTQKQMDLARSIQWVTEEVVLRLSKTAHKELSRDSLCLAGGVALNCVANGRVLREGPFRRIWIQPAAGDAGGALGAAQIAWHQYFDQPRTLSKSDSMNGSYLGPSYSEAEIERELNTLGASYERLEDPVLYSELAKILADEAVVGWFQGRMEFGPRALGARSILGDARSKKMQSIMNLKIKHRESFRPFAPAVLSDDVSQYFDISTESPYMLLVAPVLEHLRVAMTSNEQSLFGIEKLNVPKSTIPAVTHVDYSARIQTVHADTNPRFYKLIEAFKSLTGCSVLINTSFNVRGEPIVCNVRDAYQCFMRTEMDYLVLEGFILDKKKQKPWVESGDWRKEHVLD